MRDGRAFFGAHPETFVQAELLAGEKEVFSTQARSTHVICMRVKCPKCGNTMEQARQVCRELGIPFKEDPERHGVFPAGQ